MSHQFDLDSFLASPSISLADACRKDDLAKVASHFGLTVFRQILKKELKKLVLDKLVELQLVEASELTASAMVEDDNLGGEACRLLLEGAPPSQEEVEVGKPPATVPLSDPPSPSLSSAESKEQARLKIRLARLKLESQEKIQARQAELSLQRRESHSAA